MINVVLGARRVLSPAKRQVVRRAGTVRESYRRTKRRLDQWLNRRGRRRQCYLCQNTCARFLPLFADDSAARLNDLFEMAGSDVRSFYCPHCKSFDRERHLFMYFDRLGLWDAFRGAVLHFAPEKRLRARIDSLPPQKYVAADLSPRSDDVQAMSVTEITFQEGTFDAVLCNHVLEHVPDDRRAMAEIFRVLKPGGLAILQTPYSNLLARSIEDPNVNTESLRQRIYGQWDHVRLYGLDFFTRLATAGFVIDLKKHADVLPDIDGAYNGVNVHEDLIIGRKP